MGVLTGMEMEVRRGQNVDFSYKAKVHRLI
jgi:hypothetical protein